MRVLVTLFHLIITVSYGYGIYAYLFQVHPPKEFAIMRSGFGGPFKYLTFWNMVSI